MLDTKCPSKRHAYLQALSRSLAAIHPLAQRADRHFPLSISQHLILRYEYMGLFHLIIELSMRVRYQGQSSNASASIIDFNKYGEPGTRETSSTSKRMEVPRSCSTSR